MVTIYVVEPSKRNGSRYEVFGSYEGDDDRYIFAHKMTTNRQAAYDHADYLLFQQDGSKLVVK